MNLNSWIGRRLTSWCWNAARITLPLFSWKYLSGSVLITPSIKLYGGDIFIIGGGTIVSEQHHWCWPDTILTVWWWVVFHHVIIIHLTILHLHFNCYHSYLASGHLVYFTAVFDGFKYWKQNFLIWNHSVRTVSSIFS